MSQWTHVAGCIRLDGLEFVRGPLEPAIRNAFGKTVEFDDPGEKWEDCNVPCGSEGSIQYEVVRTGTGNSLSWGLVYIWGDLRDYDDYMEIYQWLKDAVIDLIKSTISVRNCSVVIDVEYGRKSIIINKDYQTLDILYIGESEDRNE